MSEPERTHEVARTISIQEAQLDDAPGIADVQMAAWLDAYPNEEYGIDRSDIEERVNYWRTEDSMSRLRNNIIHPEAGTLRLVAKDGDKVVGHCFVIKKGPYNKLQVLYVLPDYQGLGVGKLLAKQGMEWLGSERDILIFLV